MMESFKIHWKAYLMELFGLGGFVLLAGVLTIFLEHPNLPVMESGLGKYPLLRRIPLGIILGAYVTTVVVLFGKKSGAHINPAVTWTFYSLHKIDKPQAVIYTIAQFGGATASAQLLKLAVGKWFAHPLINFGNTEPKPPHGLTTAFIAEFIISFIIMLSVLMAGSSKRFEKHVALISGVLIALYLIIELPFSGMSLNPARSLAAAFTATKWKYLWVYFLAPPSGMLIAGEIYKQWKKKQLSTIDHSGKVSYVKIIPADYMEISTYPILE